MSWLGCAIAGRGGATDARPSVGHSRRTGRRLAAAFLDAAPLVAEIFRPPDIDALLFFALLMLTDPPTSPAKPEHQVWFGLIVAASSCFAFLRFGALWFLTGGLLVGNAYESLRRLLHRRSVEAARLRRAEAG